MSAFVYDSKQIGKRLCDARILLGQSQITVAKEINLTSKYYSDIERGVCGMSLPTMLLLADHLNLTLDYMILGRTFPHERFQHDNEILPLLCHFDQARPFPRKFAYRFVVAFLNFCEKNEEKILSSVKE